MIRNDNSYRHIVKNRNLTINTCRTFPLLRPLFVFQLCTRKMNPFSATGTLHPSCSVVKTFVLENGHFQGYLMKYLSCSWFIKKSYMKKALRTSNTTSLCLEPTFCPSFQVLAPPGVNPLLFDEPRVSPLCHMVEEPC